MFDAGLQLLDGLRKKWIRRVLASLIIFSLAFALLVCVLLHLVGHISFGWILVIWPLCFFGLLILNSSWRISNRDIARWLDRRYTFMEESSSLLLSSDTTSGSLKELQTAKITRVLKQEYDGIQFPKKISRALRILLIGIVVAVGAEALFYFQVFQEKTLSKSTGHAGNQHLLPAAIRSVQIRIEPPVYTRRPSRVQDQPDIIAESGAVVHWEIKTDRPVHDLQFILDDSVRIKANLKPDDSTIWYGRDIIRSTGFYQIMIDSQLSSHYKMEIIRDGFPEIKVESPKPKTILEYGMSERVAVRAIVLDDYGVRSSDIHATISSGTGDAVKFTEKIISFPEKFTHTDTRYRLQTEIDLKKMGLVPGDELYFYVAARDNYGQEKKSGIYIVTLADTADLMSADLTLNGINAKPEFFRSQRQIILETQELLANRQSMPADSFKNKSNDLGIDQEMLRLRYGKFLGNEEYNEAASGNPSGAPASFGDAAALLNAYTDKHDNAEDAGYFEEDTKKQLKAMLAEMWNAALPLRSYHPEIALPFEYKALRMLKDLQQKSRVYVAKAGYKTTPIDLSKRLTGEQGKIIHPIETRYAADDPKDVAALRQALAIIQAINKQNLPDEQSLRLLENAGIHLREKAIQDPGVFLNAYSSFQKMMEELKQGSIFNEAERLTVERAFQTLIASVPERPNKTESGKNRLSDIYFQRLKHAGE